MDCYFSLLQGNNDSDSMEKKSVSFPPLNGLYITKIFVAFLFIFAFGATFTMVLENLPQIILYIDSSLSLWFS